MLFVSASTAHTAITWLSRRVVARAVTGLTRIFTLVEALHRPDFRYTHFRRPEIESRRSFAKGYKKATDLSPAHFLLKDLETRYALDAIPSRVSLQPIDNAESFIFRAIETAQEPRETSQNYVHARDLSILDFTRR